MHQCLEIPEILELIFESIMNVAPSAKSRKTLLALALTHHGFKHIALDVLWHTQTSLVPLIKCTPDDLWEESPVGFDRDLSFIRPIVDQDFIRFDYYARRIWRIDYVPYGRHREDAVTGPHDLKLLRELSEFKKRWSSSQPDRSLFPNLRWLRLPSARYAFFASALFLGDQLNSLSLPWSNSLDEHYSSFRAILTRLPGLGTLDLESGKGLPFRECRELSESISHLKSLRRLATGPRALDASSILHLASLPSLRALQFPNTASDVLQSLTGIASHPFIALQHLEMNASTLKLWPALLERLNLLQLQAIKLNCSSLPSTADIHEFFLALSDLPSQPHMRSIHLVQSGNSLSSIAPKVNTDEVVDFWILAPLLVFDNLTTLDFTFACSFSFDDQDIATMAASWPKLQYLQLGSPLGWGQPSGITLRGILALVKACPELKHLGLTLDASCLPSRTTSELEHDTEPLNAKICARTSSVNAEITYLQVGDSYIEDARAVAGFLHPIFPNVRGIGGVWLYLRAGSFTHQERERHALWQDVALFMKQARNRARTPGSTAWKPCMAADASKQSV